MDGGKVTNARGSGGGNALDRCKRVDTLGSRFFATASMNSVTISSRTSQFSAVARSILGVAVDVLLATVTAIFGMTAAMTVLIRAETPLESVMMMGSSDGKDHDDRSKGKGSRGVYESN